MTRLVDAGLVSKDWQNNKYKGIVTNSVVSIVTRPGATRKASSPSRTSSTGRKCRDP